MNGERLAEIRKWADDPTLLRIGPTVLRELLDHVAQLEARRGGAVVVPAMTNGDCHGILSKHCGGNDMELRRLHEAYRLAVSRIQPIPASQVLQPGIVGVDREDLKDLVFLGEMVDSGCYRGDLLSLTPKSKAALDRLRSQAGEASNAG